MKIPRIYWNPDFDGPYLSPQKNTVAPDAVTTPDFLYTKGEMVYYIGAVEAGRERIIRLSPSDTDLERPSPHLLSSASVVLNTGPYDFDCYHVYDPATILWNEKIYLFYSAIGKGSDSIGLAVSDNGREFTKMDHPVLTGRSPEVVYLNRQWYLFYVLKSQELGYQIYLSISEDCANFRPISSDPVVSTGIPGSWDQYEVTTPRIFSRGGTYYMNYGGSQSPDRKDMPEAFGLARSDDLIHWEKYPHNPIFDKGMTGSWDDGAIWFGTVFEWNNHLYLFYEGERLIDMVDHTPALTRVGLAKISCTDFDLALAGW